MGGHNWEETCFYNDIVNKSKNHPASTAVADDIDFAGGIAFS